MCPKSIGVCVEFLGGYTSQSKKTHVFLVEIKRVFSRETNWIEMQVKDECFMKIKIKSIFDIIFMPMFLFKAHT